QGVQALESDLARPSAAWSGNSGGQNSAVDLGVLGVGPDIQLPHGVGSERTRGFTVEQVARAIRSRLLLRPGRGPSCPRVQGLCTDATEEAKTAGWRAHNGPRTHGRPGE